jgi:uncharacterized protein (TIGR00369 family)
MVIRDVGHGRVSFDLPVGEHLYNPLGTVHGGMTSTILDSAMGCAVSTTLAAGWGWTTLDLHVTFTKGITTAVGTITAVGEVVTTGRRVATATGRVVGPDGTLYATATTTCLVMPPR